MLLSYFWCQPLLWVFTMTTIMAIKTKINKILPKVPNGIVTPKMMPKLLDDTVDEEFEFESGFVSGVVSG